MTHQRRNVIATLAQRRKPERDKIYTVIEILAECALTDHAWNVGVGGAHHPDVDLSAAGLSHRLESMLLQHAQ